MVGLQTLLGGSIQKEHPSKHTISICADTLDLEDVSAWRAEIDEVLGQGFEKVLVQKNKFYLGIYPY